MRIRKTAPALLVILVPVLIVCAATPTPPPKATPSAQPTVAGKNATATPAASRPTPVELASPSDQSIASVQSTPSNNNPPPKPILYLIGTEPFSAGGKNYIRLRYDVLNKADYPADMFAAAPNLPPCGLNTNASRTWVDFFDAAGHRIYGFCALSKPADLGKIWIAYEEGTIPPSYVYIELNDRQTNTKYKSNLADTVL